KIRKILKISKEPISMETPIGDDDDSHLGDFIEDQSTVAPSEAAVNASLRDVCKDILDTLTPREAKVLRMRFGIEMNTDHTVGEAAELPGRRVSHFFCVAAAGSRLRAKAADRARRCARMSANVFLRVPGASSSTERLPRRTTRYGSRSHSPPPRLPAARGIVP